jgi:hypothetical protein
MVFRDDLPSHSTHCAFQVGIYSFGPEDLTAQWARYCVQFVVVRTLVPHWGDIQHCSANTNFTAFSIFLGKGAGNFVPTDSVLPVAVLTMAIPLAIVVLHSHRPISKQYIVGCLLENQVCCV